MSYQFLWLLLGAIVVAPRIYGNWNRKLEKNCREAVGFHDKLYAEERRVYWRDYQWRHNLLLVIPFGVAGLFIWFMWWLVAGGA